MIYKDNYTVSAWGEVRLPANVLSTQQILKAFSYCKR